MENQEKPAKDAIREARFLLKHPDFLREYQQSRKIYHNTAPIYGNHEKIYDELGHAILHPDINVSFSIPGTCPKTAHYEWEADTFAVRLLSHSLDLYDGITIQQAASICGIPPERAKWLRGE